ncbi:gabD [Symbiodinium microadriaticum]|nr:gabD [Symbiodinium microadriaticum]
MHSNIDDLARIITLECGKPLPEARGEVMYAAGFLEWYAEEAKRMYGDIIPAPVAGPRKYLTTRQAVGPAALITPWNFPSAMITRKIAPAFAAGCTVTIKPAEETPLSALALCVLAQEAGVPDGVMNVVTVTREDVVAVGTQFCHSDYYRKISFTGSTNVGKWLLRESAMSMKRVCLENGGNAPFIIFDDADLDVALRALMAAKFRNAGQACIAANRIYVQDGVYDKFADMLTSKVSTLVCGDGLSAGVTMGPLINEAGVTKVDRQVQDCLAKGAILRCGGSAHTELNAQGGTFYLPTVLTEVTADMQPFLEETFGPVAPLCRFSTEEDVIHQANATRSGLAGYACTSSLSRAWRVAEELEFGLVGINEGAISSEVAPFGGMKDSGLGREGGHQGLEAYLETKYIHMLTE